MVEEEVASRELEISWLLGWAASLKEKARGNEQLVPFWLPLRYLRVALARKHPSQNLRTWDDACAQPLQQDACAQLLPQDASSQLLPPIASAQLPLQE